MNLSQYIKEFADRFGDSKEALIFDDTGESWSYRELNEKINYLSSVLIGFKVKPADRVSVLLRSRPELIFWAFAIFRIGAIYVPINVRLKEGEAKHILTNSEARVLIYDESVSSIVDSVKGEIKTLNIIIKSKEYVSGEDNITKDLIPIYAPSPEEEPIAAIMYTGGTTGLPKGVILSHNSIIGNTLVNSRRWLMDKNDTILNVPPLFHIGGMAAGPFHTFLNGGTLVMQEYFEAEKYVAAVKQYKVTCIWGVPTFYYTLNRLPDDFPFDFSSVRLGWGAAGPFPTVVRKAFERRFGVPVYQYYGLTENSPGITSEDPKDNPRNYEAVGTALPGNEIIIVNDADEELPPGEIGELCVRGPYMMKGYWRNEEATRKAVKNGWLHTGDLGFIDKKGYFYITDRKHDMIIVGGANVYPAEIEKILLESDSRIHQVAVVGVPDERLGEVPKAYIVLKEGVTANEEEMIAICRTQMAHYKAPRLIEFTESLPRTSIGKINKNDLRKRC